MKFRFYRRARIFWKQIRRGHRFQRHHHAAPALRIVGGLALMIAIGTLILLLPGMGAPDRLSITEALFTTTSALSVTGLSIITPGVELSWLGQTILLVLIQVGGVGFMVVAVIMFRLLGRKIALVDRLALCDSLGLVMPGAILDLTRRVLFTVLTIEAIGAVLLWLHWRAALGNGRAFFFAIFHAVSSFCNAGFDLFGALPEQYPMGIPNDDISLMIMGGLIFTGGLGIPVLANIIVLPQDFRLSLHTRLTLIVVISLTVVGGITMFLAERQTGATLADESWHRQLFVCFFQSVSARTAGFAGIQPFDAISPASQLMLIILMFIGAAPASMGGGITTGTFAILMISIWSYARGMPAVQVGKRSIGSMMVRKAAAVLTISLVFVVTATWLILMTHDVDVHKALFEVVSAFATCGLTLSFTHELNHFGQLVIIVAMFWGRLGALTIVVALAQQQRTQLVEYPEEKILIG